jgi:hypothetical protein
VRAARAVELVVTTDYVAKVQALVDHLPEHEVFAGAWCAAWEPRDLHELRDALEYEAMHATDPTQSGRLTLLMMAVGHWIERDAAEPAKNPKVLPFPGRWGPRRQASWR